MFLVLSVTITTSVCRGGDTVGSMKAVAGPLVDSVLTMLWAVKETARSQLFKKLVNFLSKVAAVILICLGMGSRVSIAASTI